MFEAKMESVSEFIVCGFVVCDGVCFVAGAALGGEREEVGNDVLFAFEVL